MRIHATLSPSLFAFVFVLACACGSSTPKKDSTGGGTSVDQSDAMPAETPEQKFARQRVDTTDKMCVRLVDCSLEDAKKTMSPEEIAQLEKENVSEMALKDCSKQYGGMALSPRQVIGIRECLSAPSECAAFSDCLVAATSPGASE